jgi:hypothetical protein
MPDKPRTADTLKVTMGKIVERYDAGWNAGLEAAATIAESFKQCVFRDDKQACYGPTIAKEIRTLKRGVSDAG